MRFKVLAGSHQEGKDKEGNPITYRAKNPERNVVDSKLDLVAELGRQKFERLPDAVVAVAKGPEKEK